jgi:hypothetical protein
MKLLSQAGFSQADLARAIILTTALAGSIFLTSHLSYNPPAPRTFSFLETVFTTGSSIAVSDVTGSVVVTSWTRPQVLINGTIVVTGEGATPDNVHIQEQNDGGRISFIPVYDDKTTGRGYMVNVDLFIPSKTTFTSITIDAIGDGAVQMDSLNASRIYASTQMGAIRMILTPVPSGDYTIVTYNGGSIALKVASLSSFRLDATSGYGYSGEVTVRGFDRCGVETHTNAYGPGTTGATISCGNHSAYIKVQTGFARLPAGNITIDSG